MKSPAEPWIAALWAQGVGLVLGEMLYTAEGRDSIHWRLYSPLLSFGVGLCVLAVFFAAAVPGAALHEENFLSPWALRILRLAPSPRQKARALALAACLLPPLLEWQAAGSLLAVAFVAAAIVASVLRVQDVGEGITAWDSVSPFCMSGLVGFYALAAGALGPASLRYAGVGIFVACVAQAVLLRQAAARHWAELAKVAQSDRGVPDAVVPLDAYVTQTEAMAAPEPAPALGPGEGPALVSSGGFRVDARKMIEKLRERQLADAGDFILAWLRCAVASDATRIEVDQDWDTLHLRFDGRAFTQDQLREPYRALLDHDAPDAKRGAQFAYGALAVLRMQPQGLWIFSGEGRARALTRLTSRFAEDIPTPKDAGAGTQISVSLGFPGLWRALFAGWRARERFGLAPARLVVNGKAPNDPFPGRTRVDKKGWSFAYRSMPGEVASRIRIYHLGCLVEEREEPLQRMKQLDVALGHPDLTLSISQASVVRNQLLEKGLEIAASLE